jgi:archaemetzincin
LTLAILAAAGACSPNTGHREQDTRNREPEMRRKEKAEAKRGFVPPDALVRARAIGTTMNLAAGLEAAFDPAPFEPIAAPLENDWLAEHSERGQTFDQYVRGRPNRPSAARRTIYLEPIGEAGGPPMAVLAEFARAHFQLPVKVLPAIDLAGTGARVRDRGDFRQVLAPEVLEHLKTRLPADAYCLIGLTATDLYPEESWNFVFGMATLRERVGVYSTARYHPSFYGEADHYPAPEQWVLRRSLKVMAHEIGHMFGMEHCTFYECVMNGSNHLEETDRRPAHLCPVCLRKLHYAVGFDPARRYRDLERVFRASKLGPEADWVRARAEAIEAAAAAAR